MRLEPWIGPPSARSCISNRPASHRQHLGRTSAACLEAQSRSTDRQRNWRQGKRVALIRPGHRHGSASTDHFEPESLAWPLASRHPHALPRIPRNPCFIWPYGEATTATDRGSQLSATLPNLRVPLPRADCQAGHRTPRPTSDVVMCGANRDHIRLAAPLHSSNSPEVEHSEEYTLGRTTLGSTHTHSNSICDDNLWRRLPPSGPLLAQELRCYSGIQLSLTFPVRAFTDSETAYFNTVHSRFSLHSLYDNVHGCRSHTHWKITAISHVSDSE